MQSLGLASSLTPPPPVNAFQSQAWSGLQPNMSALQGYAGMGSSVVDPSQQTFNSLYGNPYGQMGLQGALGAANMGGAAAANQFGIGQNLAGLSGDLFGAGGGLQYPAYNTIGAGQSLFGPGSQAIGAGANLLPYAQPILNQAFDPQNALYNQQFQRNQDQTRAAEAACGIATTPYGAGLENQSNQNFNIAWQNNLLNRMATGAGAAGGLTGAGVGAMGTGAGIYGQGGGLEGAGAGLLSTMGGLYGQGGSLAGQGAGLMGQAPNTLYQSAMLPYGTVSGIGQGQNQAIQNFLGNASGIQGLYQTPTQDYLSAFGLGNQAQSTMNQGFANQLNQNQMNWQQLMGLGQGIGGMFGAMGPFGSFGAFGGSSNPFGSMFSGGTNPTMDQAKLAVN